MAKRTKQEQYDRDKLDELIQDNPVAVVPLDTLFRKNRASGKSFMEQMAEAVESKTSFQLRGQDKEIFK